MFWKVPGFSQPSPVEQILDKEEFTLEELLDEDDIIQECKSLNGRLVAFLRERSSVEQLLRYLVEPQDSDDPKKTYKYPFTSCEVLCCELEAVFNTLLEDDELMTLLFSILDAEAPLSCKMAGYFGRVVSTLLMRKSSEMLQYMQAQGEPLLERLVRHVDTTSISDVIKRMVGADDQNALVPSPAMAQWLGETPLIELLLRRLAPSFPAEAQTNAANILSSAADTQPSPLASKLAQPESVATLVGHALVPGGQVLVPALDVCIALLEPRQAILGDGLLGLGGLGDLAASSSTSSETEAQAAAKTQAVAAIVPHLPRLVELLAIPPPREPASAAAPEGSRGGSESGGGAASASAAAAAGEPTQATPYGLLAPPLGRHRLKVVELLSALVRSERPDAEAAVIGCSALAKCLELFERFPFNNLLHKHVTSMLASCLSASLPSDRMAKHLFEDCRLLDWIVALPTTVTPLPVPGRPKASAPLRAGYLGHVTQIAEALSLAASQAPPPPPEGSSAGGESSSRGAEAGATVQSYCEAHEGWQTFVVDVLLPRQSLEDTSRWACGRPATHGLGMLDVGGSEENDMDLEQVAGLQQPLSLYHRYTSEENEDDGDDEDDEDEDEVDKATGFDYGAEMVAESLSGLNLNHDPVDDDDDEDEEGQGGGFGARGGEDGGGGGGTAGMATSGGGGGGGGSVLGAAGGSGPDDDEVLLANSDEEFAPEEDAAPAFGDQAARGRAELELAAAGEGSGPEDMVLVEREGSGGGAQGRPGGTGGEGAGSPRDELMSDRAASGGGAAEATGVS